MDDNEQGFNTCILMLSSLHPHVYERLLQIYLEEDLADGLLEWSIKVSRDKAGVQEVGGIRA
jgi:hypothetical protein